MAQTDRYCSGCKTSKIKTQFKTQNLCNSCYHIRRTAKSGADLLHFFRKGISKLKSTRTKQGVSFHLTAEDCIELWEKQGGKCALSGVYMTHTPNGDPFTSKNTSVDRLDHTKGYYPQNVQLVCSAVNMLRGSLSQEDFTWWVINIYKHHCE